ncbi:MAG: ATP-grasp domain-containing protein [Anaerolineae bacterium]|nr:ATP-grasp domain-containing protein [Anaerolineae bacterium]
MNGTQPILLCVSSYFKGEAFLRQAKAEGCRVLLLTEEKIANEKWPRESIDEVFLMPDLSKTQDVINAVSYLFRSQDIDHIVALDEYDVENVATLREHLRLPGLGQTHTRYFRDKLAMRKKAREGGIPVPDFTAVFNYDRLRAYMERVSPPWVLKPRTEASTMGIKKINNSEELWRWFDQLGDQQAGFVLEQFVPGEVYHVDSLIWDGKIVFSSAQRYGRPPLSVYHEGGIFTTRVLPTESQDSQDLKALNSRVVDTLGMWRGVTHAEYIKASAGGQFYFLEVAARVGGAHIADMVEAATGVNLWAEWARIETADVRGETYQPPTPRAQYGGLMVSLAKQEHPDTSAYNDPEIVWRLDKKNHVGLIVVSDSPERVEELLASYVDRAAVDFLAVAPPKEKATH